MRHARHLVQALVLLTCTPPAALAGDGGFQVLHHFTGGAGGTGSSPYGTLVQAPDGKFYGTTISGGKSHWGTVYRVSKGGKLSVVKSFSKKTPEGNGPDAGLVLANDGNFYGTNLGGGGEGYAGTVFKVTPDGEVTLVHAFAIETEGFSPATALVQGSDGQLYGTTDYAPGYGCCGTAFRVSLDGVFEMLHIFGPGEAGYPRELVEGSDGNFYGTAPERGPQGIGSAFRMTPTGEVTVVHSFAGPEGAAPRAALMQATDGYFYGTASGGGDFNQGTVFRMTPAGSVKLLHSFEGGTAEGSYPYAALIQAQDGNFYGTTWTGGSGTECGTVFRISPGGNFRTLHRFTQVDGCRPVGGLVQADDGLLYGTTVGGGDFNCGTVFRIKPR